MNHKLQCTQRVGHAFEVVALSVCEVIHRVSFPFVACAVVRGLDHAVDNWVAEVHVGVCHIYLGAQHHFAFLYFSAVHLLEQFEAFLRGAVAVRAFRSRLGGSPLLRGDFFGCLFVHVCLAFLYQADGKVPQLLEIVGGIIFVAPLESQPLDVFLDGFHIFHVFLGRIRVVKAQVAHASVLLGDSEVHADGLGMSDVQVSVGFRRETGLYSSSVLALFQVFLYNLFNEVQAFLFRTFRYVYFCHSVLSFLLFLAKVVIFSE